MKPLGPPRHAPFAAARRIGMPRALLYFRYGTLWTTFFQELGRDVVTSAPTDKGTVTHGDAVSNDECCLASKIYLGHVASLLEDGACDAVFVPSVANVGLRQGFCTKFQALPDLVANTFAEMRPRVLSCLVNEVDEHRGMREALLDVAADLGASPVEAKRAWKAAQQAQEQAERAVSVAQVQALAALDAARLRAGASASVGASAGAGASVGAGASAGAGASVGVGASAARPGAQATPQPLGILLAAHPYLSHDPYTGGALVELLERMGATVLFADETDRKRALAASFEFSDTLPWVVNREIIGALMLLHPHVDGIVLVSAFPCGPDSMTDDAVVRCIQGKPILNLTIDAQSGTAGLETRVESFVDILRYQQKGGYIHG